MQNWRQALNAAFGQLKQVPKQYRELIQKHGRSRSAAIDFIEGIGGYHGGHRNGNYAVSWNVKCYGVDLDIDTMYSSDAHKDFGLHALCKNDGQRGVLYSYFRTEYERVKDKLWEWAAEEAWMSFQEDSATFWGADLDAKWHLTGRSSGHLVAENIGNVNTSMTSEALAEALREREDRDADRGTYGPYVIPHHDVVHLFLACVQVTVDWPRDAVEKEVEYRAAWRMWTFLDEAKLKSLLDVYDDPQEVLEGIISEMTEDSSDYDDICTLLGYYKE